MAQAGDPICLADLAPEPVPADQNAAIPLERIRDDLEAFAKEVNEYYGSKSYTSGRPSESQLKLIEAAFAAYPEILPTIEQAVELEGYDSGRDYSLPIEQFLPSRLDKIGDARAIARVLVLHATVLRSHAERDEAARAAIPMLRLAQQSERGCVMLTEFLGSLAIRSMAVDVANRALRDGPVSEETRNLLATELASADPLPGYQRALKAERAYGISSFNSFPFRMQWNGQKLNYLDVLEEEIRLASASYAVYSASQPKKDAAQGAGVLVRLVLPALQAARDATERTRAAIRALRVFNALIGRDDPNAPPPGDLAELGLPDDATIDPFSGKPLIVKEKFPEGWKVYSVGPNLIDDGGKLDYVSDYGVGPVEEAAETE